jgi:hypothetical protein
MAAAARPDLADFCECDGGCSPARHPPGTVCNLRVLVYVRTGTGAFIGVCAKCASDGFAAKIYSF